MNELKARGVIHIQKQSLFIVHLVPRFNDGFYRDNICLSIWAQSEEAAVSAVENAIGGGATQELYTVEARPLKVYNTEIFRMIDEEG